MLDRFLPIRKNIGSSQIDLMQLAHAGVTADVTLPACCGQSPFSVHVFYNTELD